MPIGSVARATLSDCVAHSAQRTCSFCDRDSMKTRLRAASRESFAIRPACTRPEKRLLRKPLTPPPARCPHRRKLPRSPLWCLLTLQLALAAPADRVRLRIAFWLASRLCISALRPLVRPPSALARNKLIPKFERRERATHTCQQIASCHLPPPDRKPRSPHAHSPARSNTNSSSANSKQH